MNDMRDMRDGRRLPPRNSRGEFRRRRRGDRGMDYGMYPEMRDGRVIRSYPTIHPQGDYAGDMNYDMARGGRGGRGRGDYGEYDMARGQDMRGGDYRGGDYRGGQMNDRGDYGDMHHGGMGRGGYEPVEFMGYCSGYYGAPQDYGRRGDYGYDMRGRRDYGYDYGYDYGGDYGEALSSEELQKWQKKLMEQLDEREKQMFRKEAIIPKFKQMGIEMKDFNEEELYTLAIAKYLDHKQSIGQNPDLAIKLAKDALCDQDAKYKGSEWLAIYFDEFVDD